MRIVLPGPTAWLAAFAAFLIAAIAAVSFYTIRELRERALVRAEQDVTTLNHVLAEATSRAVQGIDLLLGSTVEWYGRLGGKDLASGESIHAALNARLAAVPQVSVLTVTDAEGTIVFSSRRYPAPAVSVADVPNFFEQRNRNRNHLYIDAPRRSQVDGQWSLYFSRPIRDRDGRFRGIVSALVYPRYFEDFFRSASIWDGGAVALMRADAVLLARHPSREDWLGRSFAHGEVYTQILSKGGRGVIRTHSVVDRVDRVISGQLVAGYPLAVNVSVTEEAVLAEWRRTSAYIAGGAAAAAGVLAVLLVLLGTQLRRQERLGRNLAESESNLAEAQRIAHLGSWSLEAATGALRWSLEGCRVLGSGPRPPADTLPRFLEAVHPADRNAIAEFMQRAQGDVSRREIEVRLLREDGTISWIEMIARPSAGEDGVVTRVDGTMHDVTERRKNEEQLRLAASVFERSSEANMVVGADGRIASVNAAFTRITGYSAEEAIGNNPSLLKSGRHAPEFYQAMWRTLADTGHWEGEVWNRRKAGQIYPEWLSIEAAFDGRGRISHYIAIFRDISERKESEDRIRNLAYFDPLTNLPNRSLLGDRIEQTLVAAQRAEETVAILFLDLDRFKYVNDSLGHHAGDQVLQLVAGVLRACLRDSDTVARHGGDEFVLILPNVDAEGAARVAQKIIDALSAPLAVQGREVSATPSIGISLFPGDGADAESLIKNADAAMYHAKASGRANYQFFTRAMNVRAFESMALEASLRQGLARGEFFLVYQPQFSTGDGRQVGVEALLRWRHPDLGEAFPEKFVPMAEESGLIVPIGEWVLHEACRQNRAWQDAGRPALMMAVNISAVQFKHPGFIDMLRRVLESTRLEPRWLELELTESAIISEGKDPAARLREIKAMQVQLSIDDFGTGYSSLSYLKRLPIDRLKIDQSFVRDVPESRDDVAIIHSIIELGRHFGFTVIAEGVETAEQLAFLREANCDQVQGFHLGRPRRAEPTVQLVRAAGAP